MNIVESSKNTQELYRCEPSSQKQRHKDHSISNSIKPKPHNLRMYMRCGVCAFFLLLFRPTGLNYNPLAPTPLPRPPSYIAFCCFHDRQYAVMLNPTLGGGCKNNRNAQRTNAKLPPELCGGAAVSRISREFA